jgi:hypothetical protein
MKWDLKDRLTEESSAEFVAIEITMNMPRILDLRKNTQGHKTQQAHHMWLMEITSSGTFSDYIVSIAKQHAPR